MTPEQSEHTRHHAPLHHPWVVPGLIIALGLSLVLQGWTLWTLAGVRAMIRQQASSLAEQVGRAGAETISVDVRLNRSVPIQASIPVRKQLTIPISTTVMIDQPVEVPVNTPFGSTSVQIPLKVRVPVHASVPVTVDETVAISTSVNLDTSVPVTIPLHETMLSGYLEELRRGLLALSQQL